MLVHNAEHAKVPDENESPPRGVMSLVSLDAKPPINRYGLHILSKHFVFIYTSFVTHKDKRSSIIVTVVAGVILPSRV